MSPAHENYPPLYARICTAGCLAHQLRGRISFTPTWAIDLPSLSVNRPIQWYRTNRYDRNILCLSTMHPAFLISSYQCMCFSLGRKATCFHPLLSDVSIPLVPLGSSLSLPSSTPIRSNLANDLHTRGHPTRYVHRPPRTAVRPGFSFRPGCTTGRCRFRLCFVLTNSIHLPFQGFPFDHGSIPFLASLPHGLEETLLSIQCVQWQRPSFYVREDLLLSHLFLSRFLH